MNLSIDGNENLIISLVELTTNTGIYDCGILNGVPSVDDVKASKLYKELIEDCGCSKFILVSVKSVEITHQDIASLIDNRRYAIIPEEEFVYRREENEIQRRNLC